MSHRRAITRVLVLLFALRALVPAGFMPDLAAIRDGRLEITICTPAGPRTMAVEALGAEHAGHPDHAPESSTAQDCPFGPLAKSIVALPSPPLLPVVLPFDAAGFGASRVLAVLPPAHGPPLGSRAPPRVLG